MYADQKLKDGKVGYVSHMSNPGLHQLDLESKSYKGFVNASSYGCTGTFYLAYSSMNKHAFFNCYGSRALMEMDITTDQVVHKWNFTGIPYASPDGRFVVTTYKTSNVTLNLLLDSKVYVLMIPDKGSPSVLKLALDIPGGASRLVFDKKAGKQGAFVAYIGLVYSDKIAVLDLDVLESGSGAAVSYIEGVGRAYSSPGMHSLHRPLLVSGSWLVSPATANQSLAIINTTTRRLHGMVPGVVGGDGLVAVVKTTVTGHNAAGKTNHSQMLIFILLSLVFMVVG